MTDRRAPPSDPLADYRITLDELEPTLVALEAKGMIVRIGDLVFLTQRGKAALSDNDL